MKSTELAGIIAYGAYVPSYRLNRETVGWGRGARSVTNYDEDSLTLAVAAGMDCLRGREADQIDALYLASTTLPYAEGPLASLVATALDLRPDVTTVTLTSALKDGTTALKLAADAVKAGTARQVLVIASDVRVALPGSNMEADLGDGAAAFLVGDDDVICRFDAMHTMMDDILDLWREPGRLTVRQWEERFTIDEGYMKMLPRAVNALLAQTGDDIADFDRYVIYAPDPRRHKAMAGALKLDAGKVQDGFFGVMGNTGTAFAPMLLAAALDGAKSGERILLAGYGGGADALTLTVTEAIKARVGRPLQGYLDTGRPVSDYVKYAAWRGLITTAEPARRPPDEVPAPSMLHRSSGRNLKLQGTRCTHCGTPQFPPARICAKCHTKDEMEPYRFADKSATLFTYSYDQISRTKDPPLIIGLVDFAGGGRVRILIADADIDKLERGMPLEMSFRRMFVDENEGIQNYYWKATPVRVR